MHKNFWRYCILFVFFNSVVVYLNSLQNSFVYDDDSTIVNNYFIRDWGNLPYLFTNKYFRFSAELTYRPVVTLSYFMDHTFWGVNPKGYHLTNILIHSFNSIFVFIFATLLFRKRTPAFIAALFFLSYPVFTEAVNAIGFREDLLAFFFVFLSLIFFIKSYKNYPIFYPLSLLCFLFSLFSKEMAITLPGIIILIDLVFKRSITDKSLTHEKQTGFTFTLVACKKNTWFSLLKSGFCYYYTGYILVAVFYLIVRLFLLHNPLESQIQQAAQNPSVISLTMVHVIAYYIKLLFFPFPLNADYIVPFSTSFLKISFSISVMLFFAIGIITFRLKSKDKHIFFNIIWFFLTLIPVMNFIPLGNIMAERFLYLPGAGFCMMAGRLLSQYNWSLPRNILKYRLNISHFPLIIIMPGVLTGYSFLTLKRNVDWKNRVNLWSKTIITSPNSARAHINLGNAYEKRDHNRAAFEEYKKALAIDADDADLFNNLGIYYDKTGNREDAVKTYKRCLEIYPEHARAHNNLGVIYTKQRKLDDAIREFTEAISINNLYPDAHNNLGIVYYRKGFMKKAEREFKRAIALEPNHAEAHNDLGILYNDRLQYDKAINEFRKAVRIKPDYANAHLNLGAVMLKHGEDKDTALYHLKKSLQLDPHQQQAEGIRKLLDL